jgi:hypothetical protein
MHGRIYDPMLAQFLSPDPYMPSVVGHGLNAFAYVNNQPLDFVDPSGFTDLAVSTATQGGDTGYVFSMTDALHGVTPGLPQGPMGTGATAALFKEGAVYAAEGVLGVAGLAVQIAEVATRSPNPHKSQGVPGPRGPQARGSTVTKTVASATNTARLDPGHTTWQPGDIGPPPPPASPPIYDDPPLANQAFAAKLPNATLNNSEFRIVDTSETLKNEFIIITALPNIGEGALELGEYWAGRALSEAAEGGAEKTFEILDGVRRAKAAEMAGKPTIGAEVIGSGGKVVEVPIEALRSPKAGIDATGSALPRWLSTLKQTLSGAEPPPILVQPGVRGTPIP